MPKAAGCWLLFQRQRVKGMRASWGPKVMPCEGRASPVELQALRTVAVAFIGWLQGCAESHCPKRASGGAPGSLLHRRTSRERKIHGLCKALATAWYRLGAWVSRLRAAEAR